MHAPVLTKRANKMHVKFLTPRALALLVLLTIVLAVFDVNAKPMALKETGEVPHDNDNEETQQISPTNDGRETTPKDEYTKNVYKCGTGRFRKRRATPSGSKFKKLVVTWTVDKYSAKLTNAEQLSVFKAAFKQWDDVTTLNFSYVSDVTQADIVISFLTGHFDGPGNTLAHAYSPTADPANAGDIHFDEDENWVANTTTGGANLLAVALHEIGHAVGIQHSNAAQSVMRDTISNSNINLYEADKKAIQWMYGKCEVKDITAVLHDRYADNGDTVLVLNKDKVYRIWVHSGELFQETNEKWPKDIKDYYRLTSSIYNNLFPLRAALFIKGYNDVYLFGKTNFVRKIPTLDSQMTNGRYYEFEDHHISGSPEGLLPYSVMSVFFTPEFFKNFSKNDAKFGAAFEEGLAKHWQHYFMQGTHYRVSSHDLYEYLEEDMSVNFPGAPREPDAAWYDNRNKEWYFFKGNKYYKWDASVQQFTNRGPISLLWHSVCD